MIFESLSRFLEKYYTSGTSILLAYSGGPDSLALLHLLLEYQKIKPFQFALAHVDHGWRPESGLEAAQIEAKAKGLGITLHSKRLDPSAVNGNLEAACREERLIFFAGLCQEHGYRAVLLAHHADDAAETVLKRVLEGSALPYISGLTPVKVINGMHLWRPLLEVGKAKLGEWLNERGLVGFLDSTNEDPRFLRGRFRSSIIPKLSAEFGKDIKQGLCQIGGEAKELRDYLDAKVLKYLNQVVKGPFGSYLDLSEDFPGEVLELRHLLRKFCENEGFSLTRDSLKKALDLLTEKASNKRMIKDGKSLYLDRRHVFVTSNDCKEGVESWSISVTPVSNTTIKACTGWKSIWKGEGFVILPKGDYHLSRPENQSPYRGTSPLSKWWTDHKIPSFLRFQVPVLCRDHVVVHEFLSGKVRSKLDETLDEIEEWVRVSISV